MSSGIQVHTTAELRSRSDVAGVISGILGFLGLAFLASSDVGQFRANQLAFFNLLASALGGVLAVAFLPSKEIDNRDASQVASRTGVRTGYISAGVASGATLLFSVWGALWASSAQTDFTLRLLTGHSLLVFIVSFLSCGVAGLVGGILTLSFRRPDLARVAIEILLKSNWKPLDHDSNQPHPDRSLRFSKVLILLIIAGWLSPCILLVIPVKTDPPVVRMAPPAPIPFRYTKPAGFDESEATWLSVFAIKSIPNAQPSAPMLMTPDGVSFAYCPIDALREGTISVVNLDTLENTASFRLPTAPSHLAWSPDCRNLLFTTADGLLGIANLQSGMIQTFPRPKGQDLPNSRPIWWDEKEVVYFPSNEGNLLLSLDSLKLQPIEESTKYKAQTPEELKSWELLPVVELPHTGRSQMTIVPVLRTVIPPGRKQPTDGWDFQIAFALAFLDASKPRTKIFPKLNLMIGDRLIPAKDGSKIIHIGNSGTSVIFLTLNDDSTPLASVSCPKTLLSAVSDVKDYRLCAFAYAPMKNPLTGRTIGPDREHVRARFRVNRVSAGTLDLWEEEEYECLQPDDVIADLHTYQAGVAVMVKSSADKDWWSAIMPSTSKSEAIPKRSEVKTKDSKWTVNLFQAPYNLRFDGMAKPVANVAAVPSEKPKEVPPVVAPALPSPPPLVPAVPSEAIEQFVINHHKLASEGNVDALIQDYVDSPAIDEKLTSKAALREEELQYHRKWNKISELPRRPFTISPGVDGGFAVTYTVDFRNESAADSKWIAGMSDVSLQLKSMPQGFLIVHQNSHVHDRTDGSLGNAILSAPGRKWVTTLVINGSAGLQLYDELRVAADSAIISRKFMLVNPAGNVIATCFGTYTASAQVRGNSFTIKFASLKWDHTKGDANFRQAVNANAMSWLGQSYTFRIEPSVLTEAASGITYNKVDE